MPQGSQPTQILPKSQVTLPLAPSQELADTSFFIDAQDERRRFYLPRYRLATETVSGQQRFLVELRQAEQGGTLTVTLEKFPALELGLDFRDTHELHHTLDVRLQFSVALGNSNRSRKELTFDQQEVLAQAVRLTLHAADLNQLTQLYQAMTQPSYESVVLIQRLVEVAIPVTTVVTALGSRTLMPAFAPRTLRSTQVMALPLPAFDLSPLPNPTLRFVGANEITVRGEQFRRFELQIENWNTYPDELFAPSPDLPPCGTNRQSARTWVDILDQEGRRLYGFCTLRAATSLQQLFFSLPIAQVPPLAVSIVLRDRRLNRSYPSNSVATPVDTTADHNVQLIVPTRGQADEGGISFTNVQLRNVGAGDKVSLLLEFPDQPALPLAGVPNTLPLRLQITDHKDQQPLPWIQPLQATVQASGEVEASVESAQLFGTPEGQVAGMSLSITIPAQQSKQRLRTLLITLEMPIMLVSFPMADHQTIPIKLVAWQNLPGETEPFYRIGVTSKLANDALQFIFDPTIHAYVYPNIVVDPNKRFGLVRRQEEWKGQTHFYFQDDAMRNVVYYLPDHFKLGRKAVAPYTPDMVLYFDKTEQGALATLHYRAVPEVDRQRLQDTEPLLRAQMQNLPSTVTKLTFKPLLIVDQLSYKLALPCDSSDLGPYQSRPQAQVSLRDGIQDAVTLGLEDFLTVFDSLLTPTASMFDGRVELMVEGEQVPAIPLIAKLHDMAGELLSVRTRPIDATQLEVTVRNEIESTVLIRTLPAHYQTTNGLHEVLLSAITFPVEVAAGAEITCIAMLPEAGAGTLLLDQRSVEAMPDHQSVWDAIVDPVIQPEFDVEINVVTWPEVFTRKQLLALQVNFPHLVSVSLTPTTPQSKVKIGASIQDYVLQRGVEQVIRYRLEAVHETYRVTHEDWIQRDGTTLFITDDDLPHRA